MYKGSYTGLFKLSYWWLSTTHMQTVPRCQKFIHLKPGFQTPVFVWRRDFCTRWTDSRKKPTLTPPRMTTPEIRALVTGFSGWEESSDAVGWKVETDMISEVDKHELSWFSFRKKSGNNCLKSSVSMSICFLYTQDLVMRDTSNFFNNAWRSLPSWELLTGVSSEKRFLKGWSEYFYRYFSLHWLCGCIV